MTYDHHGFVPVLSKIYFTTPMLIYFGFRTHASYILRIPESRVSSSSSKVRVKGVKLKGIQLNIFCVWGHKLDKIVLSFA